MKEQHDAHVMSRNARKARAELDAQKKVLDATAGMNSDQARRVLHAAAAMYDIDICAEFGFGKDS